MARPAERVPDYMTVPELARRLGFCTKTVRLWIKNGKLRVHRLEGRIRVSEDDLLSFLAERRR